MAKVVLAVQEDHEISLNDDKVVKMLQEAYGVARLRLAKNGVPARQARNIARKEVRELKKDMAKALKLEGKTA